MTLLDDLFLEEGRVLLTGTGREFIQRIGIDAAKEAVLNILMGENVRKQTEPLTQQRIAQTSGALLMLFARGISRSSAFRNQLSELAVEQLMNSPRRNKSSLWLARWLIGLTGKSVQNVLRNNIRDLRDYIEAFEQAIRNAAEASRRDYGKVTMTLSFIEDKHGAQVELDWNAIIRLMIAVGSLTLTLRGSEKSTYGKLFERLILGSVLSLLDFEQTDRLATETSRQVFWLSDSRDIRECDATVLLRPGKSVRFDIGFIGPGNSEISKDKLSRYSHQLKIGGRTHTSKTFIIVDRLPETSKTREAADKIGAEIVQMSMQYWPRDLAQRLERKLGYKHPLSKLTDSEMRDYMKARLANISIENFLVGVSAEPADENGV